MGKKLLAVAIVILMATSLFAAGKAESTGKTVVTVWHSER